MVFECVWLVSLWFSDVEWISLEKRDLRSNSCLAVQACCKEIPGLVPFSSDPSQAFLQQLWLWPLSQKEQKAQKAKKLRMSWCLLKHTECAWAALWRSYRKEWMARLAPPISTIFISPVLANGSCVEGKCLPTKSWKVLETVEHERSKSGLKLCERTSRIRVVLLCVSSQQDVLAGSAGIVISLLWKMTNAAGGQQGHSQVKENKQQNIFPPPANVAAAW